MAGSRRAYRMGVWEVWGRGNTLLECVGEGLMRSVYWRMQSRAEHIARLWIR